MFCSLSCVRCRLSSLIVLLLSVRTQIGYLLLRVTKKLVGYVSTQFTLMFEHMHSLAIRRVDRIRCRTHSDRLGYCLPVGRVGCCDSSKGMRATKHFVNTIHPLLLLFLTNQGNGVISIRYMDRN
jgi:hypothetical protein